VPTPETIGTGRHLGGQIGLEGNYLGPQRKIRAAEFDFQTGEALTGAVDRNMDFLTTNPGLL
jgi:hypothetical protein